MHKCQPIASAHSAKEATIWPYSTCDWFISPYIMHYVAVKIYLDIPEK